MRTIEVDGGRWWWRGPLVGPSSTGALSGHSALLFSVFLFSLPFPLHLGPGVPFFSPLPLVPLPPVSWFVPPAFPVLLPSSPLLATNQAPLHPCANECESNTARPIRGSSKLPLFLRAAVADEES